MSVQPGPTFKRYAANGVATVYAIPFLLLDAADLQITLNGVLVTAGFTLSGIGNPVSSCVFAAAPTGDLLFQQVVPFQRLTDYQINGDLLAQTINLDLDRLWLAIKQLNRDSSRALTVSLLEPEGIPPLPVKAVRALKILAFDADGNSTPSNLTLAQIEQQPALAIEAVAQAQAAATAASTSADQAQGFASSASASAGDSSNSAALAQKWAENPEDTPVTPGLFSAHHWSNKAAAAVLTTQKQIQEITATVAGNALTFGWVKTPISFRSATLASGAVNTRNPAANLSLVIPSGATLGTANGVQARLVLLALDNAGAVELAVINLAGGINLDETTLISTTAISSSANSASVAYSAIARTNVPFRVVGFINIAQATAGAWVTVPSTIQGAGGEAGSSMAGLGYGQTWQNLLGSRAVATTYTNTTGRPISVSVGLTSAGGNASVFPTVNGVSLATLNVNVAGSNAAQIFTVPPGHTYSATGTGTLTAWVELR